MTQKLWSRAREEKARRDVKEASRDSFIRGWLAGVRDVDGVPNARNIELFERHIPLNADRDEWIERFYYLADGVRRV